MCAKKGYLFVRLVPNQRTVARFPLIAVNSKKTSFQKKVKDTSPGHHDFPSPYLRPQTRFVTSNVLRTLGKVTFAFVNVGFGDVVVLLPLLGEVTFFGVSRRGFLFLLRVGKLICFTGALLFVLRGFPQIKMERKILFYSFNIFGKEGTKFRYRLEKIKDLFTHAEWFFGTIIIFWCF